MGRIDAWLFAPDSARRLAALRIGLCAVLAIRLGMGRYADLSGQPEELFRPLSFMHLFSSMPGANLAAAVQALGVAAAVLATVGWLTRLTLPVAWGSAVFLNGMATSLGKVVHNDVVLLLAMVPLLAAPVADAWALDAARRRAAPGEERSARYGWPIRTAMVVVAGAYLFTGFNKLLYSGPAWVTSDNLRWVLYAASDQRGEPVTMALLIADRPWLAHALAAATLAIELGFPLTLVRPRLAWLFVPGAAALHLGIWFTLHLDYFAWVATAVIVFVPWPQVLDEVRNRLTGMRAAPVSPGHL
jgi:hypothetical protein